MVGGKASTALYKICSNKFGAINYWMQIYCKWVKNIYLF